MAHADKQLIEGGGLQPPCLKNGHPMPGGTSWRCNCGNLLQMITDLSEAEILTHAHTGIREWTAIAEESCSVTGAPVSLLLTKLEQIGLRPTGIHNIEYLAEKEMLGQLPGDSGGCDATGGKM